LFCRSFVSPFPEVCQSAAKASNTEDPVKRGEGRKIQLVRITVENKRLHVLTGVNERYRDVSSIVARTFSQCGNGGHYSKDEKTVQHRVYHECERHRPCIPIQSIEENTQPPMTRFSTNDPNRKRCSGRDRIAKEIRYGSTVRNCCCYHGATNRKSQRPDRSLRTSTELYGPVSEHAA
jgi:hypothetical protein